MTELRRCRRVTCGKKFAPGAADLLFCPTCRTELLAKEAARSRDAGWVLMSEANSGSAREVWDWQVIDERGETVWASDLARRYRNETMPRKRATAKPAGSARSFDRLVPTPATDAGQTD